MRGWRHWAIVVGTSLIVGACGTGADAPSAPTAAVPTAQQSTRPTAASTAAPTASATASPVALDAPTRVALKPDRSLDLTDLWVFIPTAEGIWTVTDPGDALILRDQETGHEIRRIEGAAPIHGTSIAFGAAWSTDYDHSVLHRYDLKSGKHTEIPVGAGPDTILATDEAIWIADHAGDSVERLDPKTLKVDRIQVRDKAGRGGPGGMVVVDGSLWMTVPLLDPTAGTKPPGLLVEIDLATSRVARTMELDMIPCAIGAAAGTIWVDACGDVAPAIACMEPGAAAPTVYPMAERTFVGPFLGGHQWLSQDGRLIAVECAGLHATDARSAEGPIGSVTEDGDSVWIGLDDRVIRVPASDFAS